MKKWGWSLKYNPGQPRVPSGDPRGGQWVGGQSTNSFVTDQQGAIEFTKDSKIKNVVYRATTEEGLDRLKNGEFDPEKTGSGSWQGSGIYFAAHPNTTRQFGPVQVKAVIDLRKPFVGTTTEVEKKIDSFDLKPPPIKLPDGRILEGVNAWLSPGKKASATREAWLKAGYDGIIEDAGGQGAGPYVYVVFNPEQVRVLE